MEEMEEDMTFNSIDFMGTSCTCLFLRLVRWVLPTPNKARRMSSSSQAFTHWMAGWLVVGIKSIGFSHWDLLNNLYLHRHRRFLRHDCSTRVLDASRRKRT